MLRFAVAAASAAWATAAFAGSEVLYAPPAAWVRPVAIPDAPPAADDSAIQPLLEQVQTRLDADGDKTGQSRAEEGWLGDPKTVHYDSAGDKTGESRAEKDWLGDPKMVHYDKDGNRID